MTLANCCEEEYRQLTEGREVVYFKANLALSDPESYSIEEKREIIQGMRESTAFADIVLVASRKG